MACALGAFALACVCIRYNICKINLVKTESVQSAHEFVYNIKEKQVKKNIIKQNPRAFRLRRSENFIPLNFVVVVAAVVFFPYFILSPHSSHFLLGLLCMVLMLLDSQRATISILVSARLMFMAERMKKKTNKRQRGCSTVHTAYCVDCREENKARRTK